MLGFHAITEVPLASLPGALAFASTVSATATLGNESVSAGALATGFSASGATSALGSLSSVTGTANVAPTGISATLFLTSPIVWGPIIPGVTTSYTNISTGASQTWTDIVA